MKLFKILSLSACIAFAQATCLIQPGQAMDSLSPVKFNSFNKPILIAYRYSRVGSRYNSRSYRSRDYKQTRRYYRNNSRYRHGGRYHNSYRRHYPPTIKQLEDVKAVKKNTVWEAPTSLDKKINEEIEKVQINHGPSSKAAGDLMLKYANQYYQSKDYEKAKQLTDKIIKMNKVSAFDGLKMDDVTKLRANAIAKINGPAQKRKPKYSKMSQLKTPRYSALKSSPSTSRYSRTRQRTTPWRVKDRIWTNSLSATKQSKSSSTSIGRVVQKGPGILEVDYQSKQAPRTTFSVTGARYPSGGIYGSGYYPKYNKRLSRSRKNRGFQLNNQGKLELLDSSFKKYKSK